MTIIEEQRPNYAYRIIHGWSGEPDPLTLPCCDFLLPAESKPSWDGPGGGTGSLRASSRCDTLVLAAQGCGVQQAETVALLWQLLQSRQQATRTLRIRS